MSYWTAVPVAIRKSKRITPEEKELYYEISDRLTEGGFSKATNSELAKALGVSERSISTRLSGLISKGCAKITLNRHKHERWIWLKSPGEQTEEARPNDDCFKDKKNRLENSFKKSIVFGDVDFEVLVEKLLNETTYLQELKNNDIQFCLTEEQATFFTRFKKLYPGKAIDCQIACYPNVDYNKLNTALDSSIFLQQSNNLSLKWCLENYEKIIKGDYNSSLMNQQEYKSNFKPRERTYEEINSAFQNIEDIEV